MTAPQDPHSLGVNGPAVDDANSWLAPILRSLFEQHTAEAVLARVADELRKLVPCDVLVILERRDDGRLAPILTTNTADGGLTSVELQTGAGVVTHVADASREHSVLSVPLTLGDRTYGVLRLYRTRAEPAFLPAEAKVARQLADVAVIALHNAKRVAELQRLADTDDLTGLANRRCFHRELRQHLATSQRHRIPLSLLLIDLDNFKQINDQAGHTGGDRYDRVSATVAAAS